MTRVTIFTLGGKHVKRVISKCVNFAILIRYFLRFKVSLALSLQECVFSKTTITSLLNLTSTPNGYHLAFICTALHNNTASNQFESRFFLKTIPSNLVV